MNVKFKYLYDKHGLAADTSTTAMVIAAFKSMGEFPRWWILVGIGGAAIIGALVWLLIKKQKERQLVVKRIQQQKVLRKQSSLIIFRIERLF